MDAKDVLKNKHPNVNEVNLIHYVALPMWHKS